MEKRVLIAVLLSFLVLYGYTALFPPPKRPVAPKPVATETAAPASSQTPPASGETVPPPAAPAPAVDATVAETSERSIVVETDVVRAVFSNRGGVITSWTLK